MPAKFGIGILFGAAGTVLLAIIVWMGTVYSGAYNIAASDTHGDVVRWTLDTSMHRSVRSRAEEVDFSEPPSNTLLAAGAGHYTESCVVCHGAPGEAPSEWSRGMRPQPPHLTEAASEWTLGEIHWIVSNGIKMTGMPAFGRQHSEEELKAIAAFVNALPGLTPQDYAALTGASIHRKHASEASRPAEAQDQPATEP